MSEHSSRPPGRAASDIAKAQLAAIQAGEVPPADPASTPLPSRRIFNRKVWAWGMWDFALSSFSAVITTFVFTVYLTNADLFGQRANTALGYALAAAGVLIAIAAPAIGQAVDRSGKISTVLTATTVITFFATAGLYFVTPLDSSGHSRLWLGLLLLALGNIAYEVGQVVYNAMLSDIASPRDLGKVSGFGWGLGYIGGIVLLLVLYVGLISPEVGWFGVTAENGLNVRVSMLLAAVWILGFALPLLFSAKNRERRAGTQKIGLLSSYGELFRSIGRLWHTDRSIVWFLISSAIYRDGLAGVFSFGAVLASTAFGFDAGEVIIFGVAANVVAGVATIAFGFWDDRLGSRKVIIISLVAMVVFGAAVFVLHDGVGGLDPKLVYWVFGLGLCIFVGPTQSASRTFLARIAPPGEEGELFGLYATTGRAVSFLAPFMYSTAILIGANAAGIDRQSAAYFGILGIVVVLALGLVAFLPVKARPRVIAGEPL
ncbi:MAG: MFS transporter [Arcanobacterium sp.]|nr:MFS transporter [Arcanobacterium sp.]